MVSRSMWKDATSYSKHAFATHPGKVGLDARTCLQCSCSGLATKTSSKVFALGLGLVSLAALGIAYTGFTCVTCESSKMNAVQL